jgi:hypothetical protein
LLNKEKFLFRISICGVYPMISTTDVKEEAVDRCEEVSQSIEIC